MRGRRLVLVPEGLDPRQQEDEYPDHGDGRGNAGPHGQVKGREEREDVDLLLRLAQQNAHGVVHVALAEVHHVLPLRRDGDGRHRHIRSLRGRTETRKEVYKCFTPTSTAFLSIVSAPPEQMTYSLQEYKRLRCKGEESSPFTLLEKNYYHYKGSWNE